MTGEGEGAEGAWRGDGEAVTLAAWWAWLLASLDLYLPSRPIWDPLTRMLGSSFPVNLGCKFSLGPVARPGSSAFLASCQGHCHMGPVVSVLLGVENGCSPGAGLPAGRVFCWAPYHGVCVGGRLWFLFLCPKGLLKLKPISWPILATAIRVKAAEMLGNLTPCRSLKST